MPRGYKPFTPTSVQRKPTEDNITDGYSKKKIPENLDAIVNTFIYFIFSKLILSFAQVIGSGIGGLSAASMLARTGKKVLVLEQHYVAGGSTHCFEDHGFEFDTGVHYVGNIHKRKVVFDVISDGSLEWDKMGREDPGIFNFV